MNYLKNKWDNLNPTIKRYITSSIDTFLSTFIPAFLIALDVVIDKSMDNGFQLSLIFGAISASSVTALRAVIKKTREYFNGYKTIN